MGGSSTPGTSAGNNLSGLFMGNQPVARVQAPTVSAPQSMLGQGGGIGSMAPTSQQPVAYTPPPSQPTGAQAILQQYYHPAFQPDDANPGYGFLPTFNGTEHGMPQYRMNFVPAPAPAAAPPAYQPSQAALLAASLNKKYNRG